jgi:hypothetical protein
MDKIAKNCKDKENFYQLHNDKSIIANKKHNLPIYIITYHNDIHDYGQVSTPNCANFYYSSSNPFQFLHKFR